MGDDELAAFSDLLVRHLATVIASERGYVATPCPACADQPVRRAAARPGDESLLDSSPFGGVPRIAVSARVARSCDVCHGGRRLWSRPRGRRLNLLSDRQLINAAAAQSTSDDVTGRDRPRG